ncbi:DUF948 domain-containing protein [Zhihengliuella salsuginis]|uniref:DUF948 domain-containing protein n=1 Tax=Zhihengliuella salsuginis TaxID=578222 RepID=A0ABQ3GKA1_9MICC|nr:DUF948 domain-containing protein [Zhihengliuella salsuginis]GHD12136.1 hypothetical protein GCM10008096_27270 [Zhihengliuella salsuginis]
MTWSDVAGLIAALAFVVLVGFLAVPIIKLGRSFDQLTGFIRDSRGTLDEITTTVASTNQQITKVDGITSNVSDASANVTAITSLAAAVVGKPLIKVAAFSEGVRAAFNKPATRAKRSR